MVTTVTLREPFEYSVWVIVAAALLFLGALLLLFITFKKIYVNRIRSGRKDIPKIKKPSPRALTVIKGDYERRLMELMEGYRKGIFSKRAAYQKLSITIRGFVSESTGIDVERFTKTEIKAFGIKSLDKLMNEYYVPEFAEDEKSREKNFLQSCDKSLGVIRKWN